MTVEERVNTSNPKAENFYPIGEYTYTVYVVIHVRFEHAIAHRCTQKVALSTRKPTPST